MVFLWSTFFKFLSAAHYSGYLLTRHQGAAPLRLLSTHLLTSTSPCAARNSVLSSAELFTQRCTTTTIFSPPAKFSRRCYSALANSHHPPHTCMYILMCIIVKRRMNYYSIYIHVPLHIHCASIPKILMTRNLFCSTPCGVLVTVVL